MSSYEGSGLDYTDYSEYGSSDDYSDTESYCLALGGYKVPLCHGCKRYKKRWISETRTNPMRPFFQCPNRDFSRQCRKSFKWEDVYLAECRNRSSEESSYVCDECLEKDGEIGEIGSASVDDKASLDRVKLEPLKWPESPESESDHIKKRIKDENVVDNIPLFGKVKDESLGIDGDESGIPLFGKVKDEPLDIDGDESVISLFGKAKHEPLDKNGDGSGMPQFGKVKDEPSDQTGNENGYVVDPVCKRCGKQKRKIDEIGSARDDKKGSLVEDKRELLTKLETGHEISAEPSLTPNPKRKRYNGVDNLGLGSKVMESDRIKILQMGLNVGGNNSSDNQSAFIKQENHEGFETPSLQLAPQFGYATRPDHPVVDVLAVHEKGGCSTSQENTNFVMEYEFFPGCSKNKEDELKLKNADENCDGTCLEVAAGTSSIDLSLKLS